MSWATRCPSCATVFRVAEDQLKISEGFVRCGRCDAVFNAREALFDLEASAAGSAERPVPPAMREPLLDDRAPPPEPAPPQGPLDTGEELTELSDVDTVPQTEEPDAFAPPSGASPEDEASERREPVWSALDAPDASAADRAAAGDSNQRMRDLLGVPPAGSSEAPPPPFSSLSLEPQPSLSPPLRRALRWILMALLVLALPLQWAWVERHALRARWPVVNAWWAQLCPTCEHPGWARVDGLSLAASSLQPTPRGQAYRLKLRIENHSPAELAMPWADLRLHDAEGKTLARRSLSPDELHAPRRLAPGSSTELETSFVFEGRLSGFEVGLFHP